MESELDKNPIKDEEKNDPSKSNGNADQNGAGLSSENGLSESSNKNEAGPSSVNDPGGSTSMNEAGPSTENNPAGSSDEDEHSTEDKQSLGTDGDDEDGPSSGKRPRRKIPNRFRLHQKLRSLDFALSLVDPKLSFHDIMQELVKQYVGRQTNKTEKDDAGPSNQKQPNGKPNKNDAGPSTKNKLLRCSEKEQRKYAKKYIIQYITLSEKADVKSLYKTMKEAFGEFADVSKDPIMKMFNEKMKEYDKEENKKEK